MIIAGEWTLNQQNTIFFILDDSNGDEVIGKAGTFTLELCKGDESSFSAGAGTKSEVANGWYKYVTASADADTRGPVAVKITAVGCRQQNLEYVVGGRNSSAVEFTYTVTEADLTPISGVVVQISTDVAGVNIVWAGITDTFGVARTVVNSQKPFLDPGTYYFWSYKDSYDFSNPDTEVVT